MERTIIEVEPGCGRWLARAAGETWDFENRANAETFARLFAYLNRPAEVQIRNESGAIEASFCVDPPTAEG
ncbi:MAG: hypothetical protein ACM3S1_08970 [Hyphomicrobiales bacterium]